MKLDLYEARQGESSATDRRLEQLKENLESAVEGMSGEQWSWRPPGKWCAAEVLEHLYLTYAGTITGFERVMRRGKPLGSRASMAQRALTFLVVRLGHLPAGREAPAIVRPRGLPAEQVRNQIGTKIAAMDVIIAQCEARFGSKVKLLDHPILGPLTVAEWRTLHLVHGRHHLKQLVRLRSQKGPVEPATFNDNAASWARTSAMAGAVAWAALAVLERMGIARIGAIALLFLFAPLVVVPLGIELGRTVGGSSWWEDIARRLQPVGAALAVLAMWLPPGRTAGGVALGWMGGCLLMAVGGLGRLRSWLWADAGGGARTTFVQAMLGVAQIDLAVGGAWFVASRLGMRPMGIQEPIGLLTAVHFHFAGFATATIAAATVSFAETRGAQLWLRRVVLLVMALPFVVAAGFVISPRLKMGAAVMFSISVAALAVFLRSVSNHVNDRMARVLLQIASGAVFSAMLFSSTYAVADFLGSDALPIPLMAQTHGLLNAFGFCLLGLLGWLIESCR
jgi:hypothetical protein